MVKVRIFLKAFDTKLASSSPITTLVRSRRFSFGILQRCWTRTCTPRSNGLDPIESILRFWRNFSELATGAASSQPISVLFMLSSVRQGVLWRWAAITVTALPSGLCDMSSTSNSVRLRKPLERAAAPSSFICVSLSSKWMRPQTLFRFSANTVIEGPTEVIPGDRKYS